MAAGTGRLLADWMAGSKPEIETDGLRMARYDRAAGAAAAPRPQGWHTRMTRPSEALIDVDALRFNATLLRQSHGGWLLAVLKANAYGHGAVACAQTLIGHADRLGGRVSR
jgi:hypothetical protein